MEDCKRTQIINRMRVLYIHQYFKFPNQSGGTRSYDLATSFVKKGIKVSVISSNTNASSNEKRWDVLEKDGITFYMLNCPYNNSMSIKDRLGSFLRFMFYSSVKALQIGKFDCVLATSTPLTVAVPALIRKWIRHTPFVFEVRDVWPEVPIKMGFIKNPIAIKMLRWFEVLIYKNAKAIVPLSIGMEKNIKKRYSNEKSLVIPNISEIERFSQIEVTRDLGVNIEGKKILLYAGTFGNVNGISYVVDLAYHTIKHDPQIIYFLFGNGKEKNDIKEYAKQKGILNKNIFIFDAVSKNDLPYLYSIATVGSSFVINNPILWDNSANKFFDSLAAAKPIVINYLGWQAEVIKKYNIGYVLPPIVTESEALSFIEYINNNERVKQQSVNALSLAEREYALNIAVDKYMSILNDIS